MKLAIVLDQLSPGGATMQCQLSTWSYSTPGIATMQHQLFDTQWKIRALLNRHAHTLRHRHASYATQAKEYNERGAELVALQIEAELSNEMAS
mgnify:CR=1 FL=1